MKILKKFSVLIAIYSLFFIFVIVSAIIKVPYDITAPADIAKVNDVIQIENMGEESGSFNTVSVYTYERVSLLTYLMALCDRKTSVTKTLEVYNLSSDEGFTSGKIQKDISITNALISAYELAEKFGFPVDINYHYEGYIVDTYFTYMTPDTLKIGDIVISVGGYDLTKDFNIVEALRKAEQDASLSNKQEITFNVKRDSKILSFNLTRNPYTDQYGNKRNGYGFGGYDYYVIDNAFPKFTIKDAKSVGPSGGLLQGLSVFNALTTTLDITNSSTIVGTGTISIDGSVGEIGGIYQKIICADLQDADIFMVPVYRRNGYDYNYVKINNEGNWQIAGIDSNILATSTNVPYVVNGTWYIEDQKTNVRAYGSIRDINDENNFQNESNFLEAYRSYMNLKNPEMKLVAVSSLEEAVNYLLTSLNQTALLKVHQNAYRFYLDENPLISVEDWMESIKVA